MKIEYPAITIIITNKKGVIELIIEIILSILSKRVAMVNMVMAIAPICDGIPNCCSTTDPAPAIIITATPNKKKERMKSTAVPM